MISAKIMSMAVMAALAGAAFLSAPAFAQSGSIEGGTESQTSYMTLYPKASAESGRSVTVQSEHHLYRPGDTVMITGSVSEEARQETDSDRVTVRLMDAQGSAVADEQATVNSNGEYSASIKLPANAEGEYSVGSKLEVEASVLGLIDAEIVAQLESSATFTVASSASFAVESEEGEEFEVEIASNSTVRNVELRQEEKMVAFTVDGQTGTKGVTQVTIPKAALSGEMVVMIDGQAVTPESGDVIVTSDTSAGTTFEINYSHSEHEVAVTGTTVTPEFPMAALVMAIAVGSVMAGIAVARKKGFGWKA